MCEFCNIKKGNTEVMIEDDMDVTIGKKHLESHILGMYVAHTENDKYEILSAYYVDGSEPVSEISLPIEYCPMCGRKLHND